MLLLFFFFSVASIIPCDAVNARKVAGTGTSLSSGGLIFINYGFNLRKMLIGGNAPQGKGRRTEEKEKV